MTEQKRREQLRDLLVDEIEGAASIDLPQLANKITDLVAADDAFVRGLVEEFVRPIVYEMAKRLLAQTRGEPVVELGEEIVGRSEFEQRAKMRFSRFGKWMEHAGGRYVNFMEMKPADLKEAARQREARATTELAVARFEVMLAGKLKKNEKVGDRFTPEQLEAMWEKANPKEEEEAA